MAPTQKSNPWATALGVAAGLLLLVGWIVIGNTGPGFGGTAPTTGQLIGAGMVNLGALSALAFVVVQALRWQPFTVHPQREADQ